MKPGFTVGETARICSIPADTLRYYDKIGLIRPSVMGENGYRYYKYEDFLFLNMIKYLKKLGMPLADMKKLFDRRCKEATRQNFFLQLDQINQQIEELQGIRLQLLRNIHYFDLTDNLDLEKQEPEIREYPDRLAILSHGESVKRKSRIKEQNVSADFSKGKSYDMLLSDVLEELGQENFWSMGPSICVKAKGDILSGRFDRPRAAGNMLVGESQSNKAKKVPGGSYACLYHGGSLEHMGASYERLLDFINDNDMEITGDICEIFLVDTIDTKIDEELVTHIQIPVRRRTL